MVSRPYIEALLSSSNVNIIKPHDMYLCLTHNFIGFIQMSGMILGGCLEADKRLREYEAKVRVRKRLGMDQMAWEQYELEWAEMRAKEQRAAAAAAAIEK